MSIRSRTDRPRTLVAAFVATSALTAGVALQGAGCQQTATAVSVRSLERSGRVSFVCLGPPGAAGTVEMALEACSNQEFADINSYPSASSYVGGAGGVSGTAGAGGDAGPALPHLYALVTQTTRGEVAVIDTSSITRNVLDSNPIEPGANLLPIGAQPTSIVSTPGSVATFVGVGEIGRAGIFALPSSRIRPASASVGSGTGGEGGAATDAGAGGAPFDPGIAALSSWPACALPAAPGDILLIADPRDGELERRSCDDAYDSVNPAELISAIEQRGRQKLIATIPDLGGIVVIDAQTLLDRPAGTFDACPVERWLPLEVDLSGFTGTPEPPPPPAGAACVNPKLACTANGGVCGTGSECCSGGCNGGTCGPGAIKPRPGGLTYANGKLYVADLAAPVIHVIDMPTPCEPVERAPLLPTSSENPRRIVTTSRVSVSPAPTPDLKQYLFATDVNDGSIMMFDVGPTSTTRLPISRPHPENDPFRPRDRVRYNAPAADILVVQNDVPTTDPATGLTVSGVRCDPNPALLNCVAGATTCDISTSYRPNPPDYTTGANPARLRGTFALAALTSGRLAVIDVDDLDAPCRGPAQPTIAAGCATDANLAVPLVTSLETSCNIVQPGSMRSTYFETSNVTTGDHVPGITSYPLLHDINGSLVEFTTDGLRMEAPSGALQLHVGGIDSDLTKAQHELVMNLEDPRAHVVDQDWVVSFEGALPRFDGRLADLRVPLVKAPAPTSAIGLYDENARFCGGGVLGETALHEIYGSVLTKYVDRDWARLADYVQIANELPDELDPHWSKLADRYKKQDPNDIQCAVPEYDETGNVTGEHAVAYSDCVVAFGALDAPKQGRDLRILEAYEDHVELAIRPDARRDSTNVSVPLDANELAKANDLTLAKCCFPGAIAFAVRNGQQWTVNGVQTGFLHHVVADPATGRCRNSCDPLVARFNGRALETPPDVKPEDESGFMFMNPMFRFLIRQRTSGPSYTPVDRDFYWSFTTAGAFTPLVATLSNDPATLVQPQGMQYLSPTGEVVITDGSINGIIFMSLSSVQYSRSYF